MNERLQKARNILDRPSGADLKMFVALSADDESEDGSRQYRRFAAADHLLTELDDSFLDDVVRKRFLREEADVIPEDYIASGMKGIFEIGQSDVYRPFDFERVCRDDVPPFALSAKERLEGFIWRVTGNADSHFWVYQHIHAISPARRKLSVALFDAGEYRPVTEKGLLIEHRVDLIVVDDFIYADKVNLLERSFGYERKIRAEATRTIEMIEDSEMFEGTEVLHDCLLDENLADARRLTKLKESPVLELDPGQLRARIDAVPSYKRCFDTVDGRVRIDHRFVREFLKMLDDDLVESPLTGMRYDAPKKRLVSATGTARDLPESDKDLPSLPKYADDPFTSETDTMER